MLKAGWGSLIGRTNCIFFIIIYCKVSSLNIDNNDLWKIVYNRRYTVNYFTVGDDNYIYLFFSLPSLVSKADCYVQLRLPTASPLPYRTKVVYNSTDPEWNETFHYRIHSAVKVRSLLLQSHFTHKKLSKHQGMISHFKCYC